MTMMPMDPFSQGLDPAFTQQLQMPQPKPGGGMFGGGKPDWGNAISAALNGYLAAGGNPAGQMGLQQLHQQRLLKQRQALEEQQYSRQRQDKRDDFVFEQDYRRDNPLPAQPTEYERLLSAMGVQPGTPQYQEHVGRFVGAKENPIVMTAYGPMPYSAVAGGGQAPAKPLTDDDIMRMQGGPTPPASAGFPGPY